MKNKQLLYKFTQISGSTILSRLLGVIREVLMVRYIGAGLVSDAFFSAFKIPNALRKVVAEGALSAALVPSVVSTLKKEGFDGVNHLISLVFIIFESLVFFLCIALIWWAHPIMSMVVPGFSQEQLSLSALFLQLLAPFIWFISSSALLAGPLQAIHHFFVPAFSPVILNWVFIVGIILCTSFNLPVTALCFFILAGAAFQLLLHMVAYYKLGFRFTFFSMHEVRTLWHVIGKFVPCALSMSVNELGLAIVTSFASFLPSGSISLIYYANRFVGIPQGVFVTAIATLLLPYFSRIRSYAPRRLSFCLFEAIKLIWWVTVPISFVFVFFSRAIFTTIFLSPDRFSHDQAVEAGYILIAFLFGFFFSAVNKIVLNLYYAFHFTWLPAIIALITTGVTVLLSFVLIACYGAVGLAFALSVASMVQMVLLIYFLQKLHPFSFYSGQLMLFMVNHLLRVFVVAVPCLVVYYLIIIGIAHGLPSWSHLLMNTIVFWFWVTPLCLLFGFLVWKTRIGRLYFLP